MSEPINGLARFQSIKQVSAGKITAVVPHGCSVQEADGSSRFRWFLPNMTVRYRPCIGDYWVVYGGDGYQSISPAKAFEEGYIEVQS